MKVMGLFVGVEGLGIVCSMVKNKLVALWLSSVGIGLFGIFNQTLEAATWLTSLGLRQSSVRDIAVERADTGRLAKIIGYVRSWSVLVGLLGASVLTSLSWPLAELIFHSGKMWWNFALLGGVMLFNALYSGETAILQGTEQYRRLARVGAETAVVGLLVSIPMYRWLGDDSVIYSIIVYSIVGLVFAAWHRDKRFPYKGLRRGDIGRGHEFVKLGAYMSIAAFVSSGLQLAFIGWLNVTASTAEVGLYSAGITLVVRYTSLIFNSVGMEYYPRVSANLRNPKRIPVFVNHEIALLLYVFTPLMLLFMLFAPLLIRLLYSEAFMGIEAFVTWGIITVILRSVSNTMSYTIVAKGDGKIYLATEASDALLGLLCCILFYKIWGITGVGVALVVWHLSYLLLVLGIFRMRYRFRLGDGVVMLFLSALLCGAAGVVSYYYFPPVARFCVLGGLSMVYMIGLVRQWRR